MRARKIAEGIHWVGVIDPDRRLFEEITPLPDGTSYNSYLVQGKEKTVLIDTVEPDFKSLLFERIADTGVTDIDYIVSNHAEQDHSGSLPAALERFPRAKVLCTPKGRSMLLDLLPLDPERIETVEDGQTLDLGGRTLEFIHAPWVHWPETMFTLLREEGILFSCDLFGSHMATNDLFVIDRCRLLDSAKRYYAEVMMPFSGPVRKNMEKIKDRDIRIIAPSHGPLHNDPGFILNTYRDWAGEEPKNLVVIPYVSMHGSTRSMVTRFIESLVCRGVRVEFFNLAETDPGRLSMALVDAATVVFGSPNILNGMHPKVVYAAYLVNALRPKTRFVSMIGSYGWGAKMEDQMRGLLKGLKVEMLNTVLTRGIPSEQDFTSLDFLAQTIAERHAAVCPDWKKAECGCA